MSNETSIIQKWMNEIYDGIEKINEKDMYRELKQVNPELFKINFDFKNKKITLFQLFCDRIRAGFWQTGRDEDLLKHYEKIFKVLLEVGANKNACHIRSRKGFSDYFNMSEIITGFQRYNRNLDDDIKFAYRKKKFLNDVLEACAVQEATMRIQRNPIMRNYIYGLKEKIDDDIMQDESKKRQLYDDMMQDLYKKRAKLGGNKKSIKRRKKSQRSKRKSIRR